MSPSNVRITSLICLCRVSGEGGRIPKASLSWTLGALPIKFRSVVDGFLFPLESLVEDDCGRFSGADMAKRFARDLWATSALGAAGSFVTVIKYLEDKKANVFVNFSSIHEADSRQSTSLFYTPKFD